MPVVGGSHCLVDLQVELGLEVGQETVVADQQQDLDDLAWREALPEGFEDLFVGDRPGQNLVGEQEQSPGIRQQGW